MTLIEKAEEIFFNCIYAFNGTSFNFRNVDYNSLNGKEDIFTELFDGRENGIILRNFLSEDAIQTFFSNLAKHGNSLTQWKQSSIGKLIGGGLQNTEPDLKQYFQDTAILKTELNLLFGFDFDERVITAFNKISGGKKTSVAQLDTSRQFAGCNIRFAMPELDGIKEHVGLSFFDHHKPMTHLKPLIDESGQLSFFMPLQYSSSGGELRLFDLRYNTMPDSLKSLPNDHPKIKRTVRLSKTETIKPGIGDLLIFNGGQIWHRVNRSKGSKPRITAGGFANFSKNRDGILLWS